MRTLLLGLAPVLLVAVLLVAGLRQLRGSDPEAELARLRRAHLGHDGRYELCIAGHCPRPGEDYGELIRHWGPERVASWYLDRRMAGWVGPDACVIGVFDRQDRLELVMSCEEARELAPRTAPMPTAPGAPLYARGAAPGAEAR